MSWEQILINFSGGSAAVAAALTALRSKKVRVFLSRLLSDSKLEGTLTSLQTVVEAQGQAIDWLRDELTQTRADLSHAREQLRMTEDFAIENSKLRARVAELELHVARLELQLKARQESVDL
jgi:septal ring factor EnvC (AmiA/AmiB activator)